MDTTLPAMAWRNLWRNRRRTLITLSSIALGVMLAIVFTGIGDSNFSQMIDLAARLGGGHVKLQHPEFLDSPTLARSLEGVAALRERGLEDPKVERTVVRIQGQLMLATAGRSYGAGFIAYDPDSEDESTLSVLGALAEGEPLEADERRGIVLGRGLADNLAARVGRKVVISLTDASGEIVMEAVRVRGIIETGAPTVDAGLCLLPLGQARALLGYGPDEALDVGLFLKDQRAAAEVAGRLRATLPANVAVRTWDETQPELAAFIAMKVAGARFMEAVILLLVAAGIFNTLFVSVMERMREFGIMLAVGFSPLALFGLVMFESLWLALLGLVAAGVVTAGPYYLLATHGIDISAQLGEGAAEVAGVAVSPVIYIAIYPENLLLILVAAVVATLASGLGPAWRAGRVAPVEAIRVG